MGRWAGRVYEFVRTKTTASTSHEEINEIRINLQTFKLEIARFARNIVKMRLFEMIFKYSVMYFAALHIEPRVAQQCFEANWQMM